MKPTVAIVGLGLIGGSLGLALRKSRRYRVLGIARRSSILRQAKRRGAIDQGSIDLADIAQADLVVICTPVATIVPLIRRIRRYLKPRAIVTDAGSVKGYFDRSIRGVRFVGAHPLAGSHKTGIGFARADLFRRATCVLVPKDRSALGAVRALWKTTGARTLVLPAAAHDASVAITSHVPHVIAHALVQTAMQRSNQKTLKALMAGSFRDATRVASADPDQWVQIFQMNPQHVRAGLRLFQKNLRRLSRQLTRPALMSTLRKSQKYRTPLFHEF